MECSLILKMNAGFIARRLRHPQGEVRKGLERFFHDIAVKLGLTDVPYPVLLDNFCPLSHTDLSRDTKKKCPIFCLLSNLVQIIFKWFPSSTHLKSLLF